MDYRFCDDCGCRVFSIGCVNCNEAAYIEVEFANELAELRAEQECEGSPLRKLVAFTEDYVSATRSRHPQSVSKEPVNPPASRSSAIGES